MNKPKVLFLDIETKPIEGWLWGIWDQNLGTNQIKKDWTVLSWSAKWLGDSGVMYEDMRNTKNLDNEKKILKTIWKLLDQADVVVTHNGDKFDLKRLNTRFVKHRMGKPSSYQSIDTLKIAKKHFNFTSNKLEYLADFLQVKHKKLTHKKFSGFSLWIACMENNQDAWKEMEVYNINDTIVLQEVWEVLREWDNKVNFSVFNESEENVCSCGSTSFVKNGFKFTSTGRFQRYKCTKCSHETRSAKNLLSKEKIASLHR